MEHAYSGRMFAVAAIVRVQQVVNFRDLATYTDQQSGIYQAENA